MGIAHRKIGLFECWYDKEGDGLSTKLVTLRDSETLHLRGRKPQRENIP